MTSTDQPPPPPNQAMWHYLEGGTQKGPLATEQILVLLRDDAIHPETQVWRTGMAGWARVRETELNTAIADIPPPVSPDQVSNSLVWVVALLPLVVGIIDASIAYENQQSIARTVLLGAPRQSPIPEVPAVFYSGLSLFLCTWDFLRIRKAGYPVRYMIAGAFLTPVYLFLRAKLLKQRPTYGIIWIATFLFAIMLLGAVKS